MPIVPMVGHLERASSASRALDRRESRGRLVNLIKHDNRADELLIRKRSSSTDPICRIALAPGSRYLPSTRNRDQRQSAKVMRRDLHPQPAVTLGIFHFAKSPRESRDVKLRCC